MEEKRTNINIQYAVIFCSLLQFSLAFHAFGVALFICVCMNLGTSKHCETISKVILSVNMTL